MMMPTIAFPPLQFYSDRKKVREYQGEVNLHFFLIFQILPIDKHSCIHETCDLISLLGVKEWIVWQRYDSFCLVLHILSTWWMGKWDCPSAFLAISDPRSCFGPGGWVMTIWGQV